MGGVSWAGPKRQTNQVGGHRVGLSGSEFFSVLFIDKGEQKVACPRIKAVLKIFYMEYLNVLRCWAVYAGEDFLT